MTTCQPPNCPCFCPAADLPVAPIQVAQGGPGAVVDIPIYGTQSFSVSIVTNPLFPIAQTPLIASVAMHSGNIVRVTTNAPALAEAQQNYAALIRVCNACGTLDIPITIEVVADITPIVSDCDLAQQLWAPGGPALPGDLLLAFRAGTCLAVDLPNLDVCAAIQAFAPVLPTPATQLATADCGLATVADVLALYDPCAAIQAFPAAGPLQAADQIVAVQGGVCALATVQDVAAAAAAAFDLCTSFQNLPNAIVQPTAVFMGEQNGGCFQFAVSDLLALAVPACPYLAPCDGSCAAPAYSFANAPTTGMWLNGAILTLSANNCADIIEIGASINLTGAAGAPGSSITMTGGAGTGGGASAVFTVVGAASQGGDIIGAGGVSSFGATGGSLWVQGGIGTGGGVVQMIAGDGQVAGAGFGGNAIMRAGKSYGGTSGPTASLKGGEAVNGTGGAALIDGGASDTGTGGAVFITGGLSNTGNGGQAQLLGGTASNGGNAGHAIVIGGQAVGGGSAGNVRLLGGTGFGGSSHGQVIVLTSSPPTERIRWTATGEWAIGGNVGIAGQVITSNGAGLPPTWQSPPGPSEPANQIVFGTGAGVDSDPDLTYVASTGRFWVNTTDGVTPSVSVAGIPPDCTIAGVSASTPGTSGGALRLQGGRGNTTGLGGNVIVSAGNGGVNGRGGDLILRGGATGADGDGGDILIGTYQGFGTNRNGGNIRVDLGAPTGTGTGGYFSLTANVERFRIAYNGEWQLALNPGLPGQKLTSQGPGLPPIWV